MATLYITVFEAAVSTALGDPIQQLTITVGGASAQSTALTSSGTGTAANKKRTVRMFSDTDCFIAWGEDPTALNDGSGGIAVGTETPEYFSITAGHKVACISRS